MCVRNLKFGLKSPNRKQLLTRGCDPLNRNQSEDLGFKRAAEPQHGRQEMRDILLLEEEKTENIEFITEWCSRK